MRALERTGDARASAEDAGIDHTTAYARRRAHKEFAAAWAEALERGRAERKRVEAEEIAGLKEAPKPLSRLACGESDLSPQGRGELTASGGKVRRVGHGRWSERKEALFFDELAATNNIHRSAAAAGVSYNAVLARRHKHPLFAAKWDAVARSARATIGMHLLEETHKSFDPAAMNLPDAAPRVTIDQAIKISQLGAAKERGSATDPFGDPNYNYEEDVAEIRERLVRKLQAIRRSDRPGLLARGWSYDESWDCDIPPGWTKGPDWRPMGPEDTDC